MNPQKAKKKVDSEALNSSFMRIPRMKVEVARALLDMGLSQIYELNGRAPEVLFSEATKRKPDTPKDFLAYFNMAVYYAESPEPDLKKMHPCFWLSNLA